MKFFAPNINRTGRVFRAIWGVLALVAGIVAVNWSLWLAVPLFALSLLAFFQARRGWCFMRACGIKTRY